MEGFVRIFVAAIILVGFCVVGLGFNIFFRKNGKFPETEISSNKEMKKRGIRCVKEEEMKLWGKNIKGDAPSCDENSCSGCSGCDFLKQSGEENK